MMMMISYTVSHIAFDDVIDDSGYYSYPKDEYVNFITSYDQHYIFFITSKTIDIKGIDKGQKMKDLASLPHGIENLYYEYIYGFCTHGYLAILKKNSLYYFKLSDDKKEFSHRYEYPASYFDIGQFTSTTGVNSWNNTVIVKTNNNQVSVLDFRSSERPLAFHLHLPYREPDDYITFVKAVNIGKSAAVFYKKSLEIVDFASKQSVKSFSFPYTVLYINYEYNSNMLVVLFRERKVAVIKTSAPWDKSYFEAPSVFSLVKPRILRTGISCLALLDQQIFAIFDLSKNFDQAFIARLTMPYNDTELKGYTFNMTYRLSNLILISKNNTEEDRIEMKHLRLFTNNNTLCHKSCYGRCDAPFIVCNLWRWVVLSMILGISVVSSVIFSFRRVTTLIEHSLNKKKSMKDKNFSRALKTARIENDEIRIRMSRLTPSMMEAIEEILPNHENDISDIIEDPQNLE